MALDLSVGAGYIRNYEGCPIVRCTMLRRVDYTAALGTIAKKREAVLPRHRKYRRATGMKCIPACLNFKTAQENVWSSITEMCPGSGLRGYPEVSTS
ncbi:hypothetical protein BJV78DRAFT_1278735 [Lactifluus subvellereus]|nr:hypothetical protein BJV78DRAFT_1278735 [Lactifluus subvellereus]